VVVDGEVVGEDLFEHPGGPVALAGLGQAFGAGHVGVGGGAAAGGGDGLAEPGQQVGGLARADAAEGRQRRLGHQRRVAGDLLGHERHGLGVAAVGQDAQDADGGVALGLGEGPSKGRQGLRARVRLQSVAGHVDGFRVAEHPLQGRDARLGADAGEHLAGLEFGLVVGWAFQQADEAALEFGRQAWPAVQPLDQPVEVVDRRGVGPRFELGEAGHDLGDLGLGDGRRGRGLGGASRGTGRKDRQEGEGGRGAKDQGKTVRCAGHFIFLPYLHR